MNVHYKFLEHHFFSQIYTTIVLFYAAFSSSHTIVPFLIHTLRSMDLQALTMPLAIVAQLTMPPKTLTRRALTLSSSVMMRKASFTYKKKHVTNQPRYIQLKSF